MKNLRKLLVISNEQLMCVGSAGTTVMCGLVEEALSNEWDVTHLALIEKSSEEVSAQKSEKFRCQNDENLEEHFVFYEKQPVSGFKNWLHLLMHTLPRMLVNFQKFTEQSF